MYFKIKHKIFNDGNIPNITIKKTDTLNDNVIRKMVFGFYERMYVNVDGFTTVIYIDPEKYDNSKTFYNSSYKEMIESLLKNELRKEKINKLLNVL